MFLNPDHINVWLAVEYGSQLVYIYIMQVLLNNDVGLYCPNSDGLCDGFCRVFYVFLPERNFSVQLSSCELHNNKVLNKV